MSTIVVGIDGSEQSKAALRWAVDEARLRGAVVEAVYAYEHTPSWQRYAYADDVTARGSEPPLTPDQDEREDRERAQELPARMVAELDDIADVTVTPVAVSDARPAHALVERSRGADMLVVGSRGRGGFVGLLLGSVSHQAATHAGCPVVIVRG